jgi:uncharacterized protein YjiS (DUF1127 family)
MATYEQSTGRGATSASREMVRRLSRAVRMAIRRHRQRRALTIMESWQLDDLGLSRAEAKREARRLPWDGASQD